MIHVGRLNQLEVQQIAPAGAFLGDGRDRVFLLGSEIPEGTRRGDILEVFVYTDTDDVPVATMRRPKAMVGQFAFLEVVDTSPHGAFVDWGLEKDLFVPHKAQHRPLQIGDRAVFFVDLHERTNRVIGATKLGRYFDYEHEHFKPNHQVRVMVYGKNPSGLHLVVDGQYRGMAYHNEVHEELAVGEVRTGWVKEVREDGLLDISLQRLGHGATIDARDVILQALREDGGFLPLHDKADPAAIRQRLSMSKGVFKKAIGGLYRDGKIRLEPGGIRLSERGR